MKEWQFNVLFFVGVGGAVLLLLGPELGLEISNNPTALTGVGAILTYVLAQKMAGTREDKKNKEPPEIGQEEEAKTDDEL